MINTQVNFGAIDYAKPQTKIEVVEQDGQSTSAAQVFADQNKLDKIALKVTLSAGNFFTGKVKDVWVTNDTDQALENYLKAVNTQPEQGATGIANGKKWLKDQTMI